MKTINIIWCALLITGAFFTTGCSSYIVHVEEYDVPDVAYGRLWNACNEVIARHFTIEYVMKEMGIIETKPRFDTEKPTLATFPALFAEPDRFERVRRKAYVEITERDGFYTVRIEVAKAVKEYTSAESPRDTRDPFYSPIASPGGGDVLMRWRDLGDDVDYQKKLRKEIDDVLQHTERQ